MRHKVAKLSAIASLSFIWIIILYVWYIDIDGFQDLEESFFYYEPMLFILALPGSLMLLLVKEILHYIFDWHLGSGSEMSISEIKMHIIGVWCRYFILFWFQWYFFVKWINRHWSSKVEIRSCGEK
jgi:hypothetical protein